MWTHETIPEGGASHRGYQFVMSDNGYHVYEMPHAWNRRFQNRYHVEAFISEAIDVGLKEKHGMFRYCERTYGPEFPRYSYAGYVVTIDQGARGVGERLTRYVVTDERGLAARFDLRWLHEVVTEVDALIDRFGPAYGAPDAELVEWARRAYAETDGGADAVAEVVQRALRAAQERAAVMSTTTANG